MNAINPFKPTAGAEPPVLAGRDDVLEDFEEAIVGGVGAPGRLMRITGPRGSGKTVLLTELGDIARRHGWAVVDETAQPQLVSKLIHRLDNGREYEMSFEIDAVVAKAAVQPAASGVAPDLRDALGRTIQKQSKRGGGLLITLDEVQNASVEDINEIAIAVQHLVREKADIAFVFAGITAGVMTLLGEEGPTFLRRAYPEELGPIPVDEVGLALRDSIERAGFSIGGEALERAAESTEGYAYLIQLVGYHVFRCARRHIEDSRVVTGDDVSAGIERASREFEKTVLETALAGLPKRAYEFILAMAESRFPSSVGDIASKLGTTTSALSSARRILIDRQVIEPTAHGYVDFSIPFMREYLLAHRSALMLRYGVEI